MFLKKGNLEITLDYDREINILCGFGFNIETYKHVLFWVSLFWINLEIYYDIEEGD